MPNSRSRRGAVSKQERQQIQNAARQAEAARKQRRGVVYVLSIGIVGLLFVFGVLGQNLGDNDKPADKTTTTLAGTVTCPRADGSSPRKVIFDRAPGRCIDATRIYEATFTTTAGKLTFELYPARAFNAVNNFTFLARYHFYDGLPFHRVLKDTFVQTGDPLAPGVTGPGYEFDDDGLPASSSQYVTGALLFAHEAADANGSQILFITGNGGQTLNPTFPLFGQLKKGFDVLKLINDGAGPDANMPSIRYSIIGVDVVEKPEEK